MKKIVKRIAAMGAAVMMMSSMAKRFLPKI